MRHLVLSQLESSEAHGTELSAALDRLKQEHGELMQDLLELENEAKQAGQESDFDPAIRLLTHLRFRTQAFMNEMEQHSRWEEQELFPFLNGYFHQQTAPSIAASFWRLEKEHELAGEYLQSFLKETDGLRRDSKLEQLHHAAAYLIHACRILKEHLEKEEQLVFPMTEEVLTDLDYLFS
ncbi:hemerythrin domain-containing protein [Paenibacillus cremeus]|uniref:Hemerythrin domain-containing protein n=1 Tax=Paenibacillus cremeus TaxID=2163881 RepID=A0A559JGL9_9BACL|nr:hemerythrin domain-containing protein [Paenibacillus cremeus]TVX99013.1 hemerythrin domain-containing protein [Paenibacillus cremeus]